MARRTKSEAESTRIAILDAAEKLFFENGVSRTTLDKIAVAAGVTRGAIYWHFQNKADLFAAMMERVRLPFHNLISELDTLPDLDPLMQLRALILRSLELITVSEQYRKILTIVFFRCEYVDDLNPAVCKQEALENETHNIIIRAFERAKQAGLLRDDLKPADAAKALHAYMGGLISNYLLKPEQYDLAQEATVLIDVMLQGIKKPDNSLR